MKQENLQQVKVLFIGQQKSQKSNLVYKLNEIHHYKPLKRKLTYIDTKENELNKQIQNSKIADIAVLVISLQRRQFQQDFFDHGGVIKHHACIAKSGGISNYIVVMDQKDSYKWYQQRFNYIKNILTPYLQAIWQQKDIIFISANIFHHMNIYQSSQFSWHKGQSIFVTLQNMTLKERNNLQQMAEINARLRKVQQIQYKSGQVMKTNSRFAQFYFNQTKMSEDLELKIIVLTIKQVQQIEKMNQKQKITFKKDGQVTIYKQNYREVYLTARKCLTFKIQESCSVLFSQQIKKQEDFVGIACDLLLSAYKFSRKTQKQSQIKILLQNQMQLMVPIIELVNVKNHSKQLGNGRGDVEGIPQYFVKQVQRISKDYDNCKITIYKGKQLLDYGFRLLHAVGRASKNQPVFANITYTGDKNSKNYIAFVGKGVCFDAGGLNIKSTDAMKSMYLDKQGACSVLTALQQIARQQLPINVTCSIGLVQNYLGPNSYRPSDIIKSRKGYTVKIDDTDAQGRLVLADAMHWTQQNFKTQVMIELSTLTYSNIKALGQKYAGMFSNDDELSDQLFKFGKNVHEYVWRMPVDIEHHQALETPEADFMSDNSGEWIAGGSVAGAFLQKFVEQGTRWAHLDIGGVGFASQIGTGWGAALLVQYARRRAQKKAINQ